MQMSWLSLFIRGLVVAIVSLQLALACPGEPFLASPHMDTGAEHCDSETRASLSVQSVRKVIVRANPSYRVCRNLFTGHQVTPNSAPSAIPSGPITALSSVILRI